MMTYEPFRAASVAPRSQSSILVVDDDEFVGQALAQSLERRGHRVYHCGDAADALTYLQEGNVPDLILLDLMMPRMSGWEFRVQQRRVPSLANVPVIAMSGDTSAQAAAIHADGYLQKPIAESDLFESVEKVLSHARLERENKQRAELEKLSSLAVLAAGIAHEINNPLTFVLGNLELCQIHLKHLRTDLQGLEAARLVAVEKLMEHASGGAKRIAGVVRGVSAFCATNTDAVSRVKVFDVLESAMQLVGNELRHHAELCLKYEPVPDVAASALKLEQVFLNLLTNAMHAVRDGRGNRREILVSTSTSSEGEALITISDTGPGIAPSILPRIFDPFFTTKAVGTGMGLGLSISQGIVRSFGGSIRVKSELGNGASFEVCLPGLPTSSHESVQCAAPIGQAPYARRPRILVIDDEPQMCRLLEATLCDLYHVETSDCALSAAEAIEQGASYDVILCDLMLPGFTGMDAYARLSRVRPDQAERMVFMTGGAFTDRASRFLRELSAEYLKKPFLPTDACACVERTLAQWGLMARVPRH